MYTFPMANYQPYCFQFYPNYSFYQYPVNQPEFAQNQQIISPNSILISKEKLELSDDDLKKYGFGVQKKHWSKEEDDELRVLAQKFNHDWKQVAKLLPGRNQKMCYSRFRRSELDTKIYWSKAEDESIKKYFQQEKMSWKTISKYFPNRTSKQIRQHYLNFLRPSIKKNAWTLQEDKQIIELFNEHGKKWKLFETFLEGRTQNQIKNRYYGRLQRLHRKKVQTSENRV